MSHFSRRFDQHEVMMSSYYQYICLYFFPSLANVFQTGLCTLLIFSVCENELRKPQHDANISYWCSWCSVYILLFIVSLSSSVMSELFSDTYVLLKHNLSPRCNLTAHSFMFLIEVAINHTNLWLNKRWEIFRHRIYKLREALKEWSA